MSNVNLIRKVNSSVNKHAFKSKPEHTRDKNNEI